VRLFDISYVCRSGITVKLKETLLKNLSILLTYSVQKTKTQKAAPVTSDAAFCVNENSSII